MQRAPTIEDRLEHLGHTRGIDGFARFECARFDQGTNVPSPQVKSHDVVDVAIDSDQRTGRLSCRLITRRIVCVRQSFSQALG